MVGSSTTRCPLRGVIRIPSCRRQQHPNAAKTTSTIAMHNSPCQKRAGMRQGRTNPGTQDAADVSWGPFGAMPGLLQRAEDAKSTVYQQCIRHWKGRYRPAEVRRSVMRSLKSSESNLAQTSFGVLKSNTPKCHVIHARMHGHGMEASKPGTPPTHTGGSRSGYGEEKVHRDSGLR